jgi:hypothetical protein
VASPITKAPPDGKPGFELITWTVKAPVVLLPAASDAVQLTDVDPIGNVDPDGGAQVTDTGPSTRSDAVAL